MRGTDDRRGARAHPARRRASTCSRRRRPTSCATPTLCEPTPGRQRRARRGRARRRRLPRRGRGARPHRPHREHHTCAARRRVQRHAARRRSRGATARRSRRIAVGRTAARMPTRSNSAVARAAAREARQRGRCRRVVLIFDDHGSPWHTRCVVEAADEPGLLHTLTVAFASAGQSTCTRRSITTEGVRSGRHVRADRPERRQARRERRRTACATSWRRAYEPVGAGAYLASVMRVVLGSDERTALTDAVHAGPRSARRRGRAGRPAGRRGPGWAEVGRRVGEAVASGDADDGRAVLLDRYRARRSPRTRCAGVRAALCTDADDGGRCAEVERRERARDELAARRARRSRTRCSTRGSRPSRTRVRSRQHRAARSEPVSLKARRADLRDADDARTRRLGDPAREARAHPRGARGGRGARARRSRRSTR